MLAHACGINVTVNIHATCWRVLLQVLGVPVAHDLAACTEAARQLSRVVDACKDGPQTPLASGWLDLLPTAPAAAPEGDPCNAIKCSADCSGTLEFFNSTANATERASCGWNRKAGTLGMAFVHSLLQSNVNHES